MSFLRKQFGFWRIFLYFLIFTTFYGILVFKFSLSNFAPVGGGPLNNAALLGSLISSSVGIFFLIYFMPTWGISTGLILGLCRFRRSIKGIIGAMLIGTLTSGISSYVILSDISVYFCLFHGLLTAIFGLVAFPNKAGILLESQIIFKIFPKTLSTGANLTNQVIEKKGFASYRWLIPPVFTLLGTVIFGITAILLAGITEKVVTLALSMMTIVILPMLLTGLTVMFKRFHRNVRHITFSVLIGAVYYSLVALAFNDSGIKELRLFAMQNYTALIIALVLSALISFKKIMPINAK
ncbi:hypothetical protein HYE66_01170 [Aggregatibacter actinomycetemcomitans]|nr:hypothetical protein [Aggregatibacter actinomycetemcomitans]